MSAYDLLRRVADAGGNITVDGKELIYDGPAVFVDELRPHKIEILWLLSEDHDVTWRVLAMLAQLRVKGPTWEIAAVDGIEPQYGVCYSCGEPIEPAIKLGRCVLCALAAARALGYITEPGREARERKG